MWQSLLALESKFSKLHERGLHSKDTIGKWGLETVFKRLFFFYGAKTSSNELSTVHFYSQYLDQLKRMSISAHAISTSCSSFCAAELQLLAILRSLAVSASGSLMFSPEMTAQSGGF